MSLILLNSELSQNFLKADSRACFLLGEIVSFWISAFAGMFGIRSPSSLRESIADSVRTLPLAIIFALISSFFHGAMMRLLVSIYCSRIFLLLLFLYKSSSRVIVALSGLARSCAWMFMLVRVWLICWVALGLLIMSLIAQS